MKALKKSPVWIKGRNALGMAKHRLTHQLLGFPEISTRKLRRFAALRKAPPLPALPQPHSLSVVIPMYGHERYLPEMMSSLRDQTTFPDEIIVVDDASPDRSTLIIKELVSQWPPHLQEQVHILENNENMGQAASLNRGVEFASSSHIMIVNDDDYLMHDVIEVVLQLFQSHPDIGLVGGPAQHFHEGTLPQIDQRTILGRSSADIPSIQISAPEDAASYRFCNDINMCHSTSSFRKDAWEAAGGYFSKRMDRVVRPPDRDFQLRVNALFPVAVVTDIPFCFWRDDSSVDKDLFS